MRLIIEMIIFTYQNFSMVCMEFVVCIWNPIYRLYLFILGIIVGAPIPKEILHRMKTADEAINYNYWRCIMEHMKTYEGISLTIFRTISTMGLDKAAAVALTQALLSFLGGDGFEIPEKPFEDTIFGELKETLNRKEVSPHGDLTPRLETESQENIQKATKSAATIIVISALIAAAISALVFKPK